VAALDFFCFGDGRAEADGKIICEMVAADGNGTSVANYAAAIDDEFGGATADIEQAAAEVALVLREAGFRGSERLEDCVADQDSGAICSGD
jgi:hypothetical protein